MTGWASVLAALLLGLTAVPALYAAMLTLYALGMAVYHVCRVLGRPLVDAATAVIPTLSFIPILTLLTPPALALALGLRPALAVVTFVSGLVVMLRFILSSTKY